MCVRQLFVLRSFVVRSRPVWRSCAAAHRGKRLIVDVGASTFGHENGRFATRGELATDAQGTAHGLQTDGTRTQNGLLTDYTRTSNRLGTIRVVSWKLDLGLLEVAGPKRVGDDAI